MGNFIHKLPKPHIKCLLRKSMLEEWQTSWNNGDTGRKIYNIMPSVNLRPTNWIREDVTPPANLKRFHLSDSRLTMTHNVAVVELARHFTMKQSMPPQ
ncbi:hypothetical protein AVEN_169852-1 [Araneus ventricosus]|uniref:Uncharacterized protein n=1 Tax=Araneus ventricosus TaxID=182803 RepID=A0A4Y2HJQ1_ARAVE|nr:hypothetical protein AVEN_169852-1 [Araneus ventricosus]